MCFNPLFQSDRLIVFVVLGTVDQQNRSLAGIFEHLGDLILDFTKFFEVSLAKLFPSLGVVVEPFTKLRTR